MKMPKLTEDWKKRLNLIRKFVPLIFLAVYLGTWFSYVYCMNDILTGDVLLEPDHVYSTSQLTAYVQIMWLAVFIWVAYLMVKLLFYPDGFAAYRLARIEKKIAELELQKPRGMICYERDHGDSDRGHDAEKGVEIERSEERDASEIPTE